MLKPQALKSGDIIGITSSARKIAPEELKPAIEQLESWGLQVKCTDELFSAHHQFAGSDEVRARSLQGLIDDDNVRAILFARGGYGTTRIIDKVDFSRLQTKPKWLIGYSDVTAIHAHLSSLGIQSIHATMPIDIGQRASVASLDSLKKALFGEALSYNFDGHPLNRSGEMAGELIGGNLSLLAHLTGTRSLPTTKGKILFIEDLDEYLYHIDRMMIQLKRAGLLNKLSGLLVGHMTAMHDNKIPFGYNACEIIHEMVSEYNYPVAFNLPLGHHKENWAVVCGSSAKCTVAADFNQKSTLSFHNNH